jgi:hypothetical protein
MTQLGAFAVCTVDTVLSKERNEGECLVSHVARYVDRKMSTKFVAKRDAKFTFFWAVTPCCLTLYRRSTGCFTCRSFLMLVLMQNENCFQDIQL